MKFDPKRLRYMRKKMGLTQDSAGKALGIGRTGLTKREGGTLPTFATDLAKFAELYQTSVDSFFTKDGEKADLNERELLCRKIDAIMNEERFTTGKEMVTTMIDSAYLKMINSKRNRNRINER